MTGLAPGDVLHASCVAFQGRGLLILGPSGSGKSALSLQLMALGCVLVSDDRTALRPAEGTLIASAPASIRGRIEARGVGILAAETVPFAPVVLAVDLGRTETDRLPLERTFTHAGCTVPLVWNVPSAHFPAAILLALKGGRIA